MREPTERDLQQANELCVAINETINTYVRAQPDPVQKRTILIMLVNYAAYIAAEISTDPNAFVTLATDAIDDEMRKAREADTSKH